DSLPTATTTNQYTHSLKQKLYQVIL
uniref:Uncharacterized protein n=1 Tax=Amphimedon queenslandica TaxID=400682 RepID=A0A1X7V488_AMPQE